MNLATIPDDIKNYIIYGYVQDLLFIEHKKTVLRKLAYEAFDEFKDRFAYDIELFLEDIHNAAEYVKIGKYENKYGPSGDRGNYECDSLEHALEHYKGMCDYWNEFVETYIDISDKIVPKKYKNAFKPIVHEDLY